MTEQDIIKAVDLILDDKHLKKEIGLTRDNKQYILKTRSIPKMLEILYKANKLSLKDGSSQQSKQ